MKLLINNIEYTYSQEIWDVNLQLMGNSAHQLSLYAKSHLIQEIIQYGITLETDKFTFDFKLDPRFTITEENGLKYKLNLFSSVYDCKSQFPAYNNVVKKAYLAETVGKITNLNIEMASENVLITLDTGQTDNYEILKKVMSEVQDYEWVQKDNDTLIIGRPDDISARFEPVRANNWIVKNVKIIKPTKNYSHVTYSTSISGAELAGIITFRGLEPEDVNPQYPVILIDNIPYVYDVNYDKINVFSSNISINISATSEEKTVYDVKKRLYREAITTLEKSKEIQYEFDLIPNSIELPYTEIYLSFILNEEIIKINKKLLKMEYKLDFSLV